MIQSQPVATANPFIRSQARFEQLCRQLQSPQTLVVSHSELERIFTRGEGRALLRQMLQDHLDLRGLYEQAAPHPLVVGDDGIARPHHRDATRELHTLLGNVTVPRIGYSQRGSTSRFPMDAALNLPSDPFSLGVRYVVALTVASNSYDQSVEYIQTTTGTPVAKRQTEKLACGAAVDFEAFYEQRMAEPVDATSSLLILSTDGKGVVVRLADLREATRRASMKRTPRLKTRLTKGEKKHAKRMSQVAAVYTVAPYVRTADDVIAELTHSSPTERPVRPRPEHKRVWASLQQEPDEVIQQLFDEAERRDPTHSKTWVVLVDGNLTQLSLIQQEARQRGVQVTIILDFIHVLQYLWKASTAFHAEKAPEREEWVLERLRQVLRGKAVDVAAGIRRSATRRDLTQKERVPVDDCADYLLKYKAYLHYDQALLKGFPIASGVIEGACRHLVKDRMDLSGAHWSLAGAEAILQLRALKASGDLDAYWAFHESQEYWRNHEQQYRGDVPVPHRPTAPSRPRLVA